MPRRRRLRQRRVVMATRSPSGGGYHDGSGGFTRGFTRGDSAWLLQGLGAMARMAPADGEHEAG
jgi:hypothetical protein